MTTVPFGACDLHGEIHDRVRLGRGGDERAVGAAPAGRVADQRLEGVGIARAGVHAEAARALDASRIEIEADDIAAGRAQQLRRDLADQSEAEDGDPLAELRRRPAHPCIAIAPTVVDAASVHRTARRNTADEIALHADVVGVIGLAGAGARDQIAGREIVDARADADDLARRRIAGIPSLRVELAERQPADASFGAVPTPMLAIVTRDRPGAPAVVTTTVTSRDPADRKSACPRTGRPRRLREPIQLHARLVQQPDGDRPLVDASLHSHHRHVIRPAPRSPARRSDSRPACRR